MPPPPVGGAGPVPTSVAALPSISGLTAAVDRFLSALIASAVTLTAAANRFFLAADAAGPDTELRGLASSGATASTAGRASPRRDAASARVRTGRRPSAASFIHASLGITHVAGRKPPLFSSPLPTKTTGKTRSRGVLFLSFCLPFYLLFPFFFPFLLAFIGFPFLPPFSLISFSSSERFLFSLLRCDGVRCFWASFFLTRYLLAALDRRRKKGGWGGTVCPAERSRPRQGTSLD